MCKITACFSDALVTAFLRSDNTFLIKYAQAKEQNIGIFFRLGKMNFDAINSMKYKQQLTVIFGIWRTGAAGVCVADEHGSGG